MIYHVKSHFEIKVKSYLSEVRITNIEQLIEYLWKFDKNERKDRLDPPQETLSNKESWTLKTALKDSGDLEEGNNEKNRILEERQALRQSRRDLANHIKRLGEELQRNWTALCAKRRSNKNINSSLPIPPQQKTDENIQKDDLSKKSELEKPRLDLAPKMDETQKRQIPQKNRC